MIQWEIPLNTTNTSSTIHQESYLITTKPPFMSLLPSLNPPKKMRKKRLMIYITPSHPKLPLKIHLISSSRTVDSIAAASAGKPSCVKPTMSPITLHIRQINKLPPTYKDSKMGSTVTHPHPGDRDHQSQTSDPKSPLPPHSPPPESSAAPCSPQS